MFGVGGGEILVIALVALLLFGTDDLPKNMRKFMKAWNDFRGVTNDLQRSWLDVRDQVTRDILTERPPVSPADPAHQTPPEAADNAAQSALSETDSTALESSADSSPRPEAISENTIFESYQQEESTTPLARPAQGALARGQLDEGSAESTSALTSAQGPDKST